MEEQTGFNFIIRQSLFDIRVLGFYFHGGHRLHEEKRIYVF